MENRKKEELMELALESLHDIDRQTYDTYYEKVHDELLQEIITKQGESFENEEKPTNYKYIPDQVKLQCRSCSKNLFSGADE